MLTNKQKVKAAWPSPVPDWVMALAEACDMESQRVVAEKSEYSHAAISSVLNNRYKGDLSAVQKAVEGALMNRVVICPVAGEIGMQQCQTNQRRPFCATNSQRVQLYRACRDGCQHSRFTEGK